MVGSLPTHKVSHDMCKGYNRKPPPHKRDALSVLRKLSRSLHLGMEPAPPPVERSIEVRGGRRFRQAEPAAAPLAADATGGVGGVQMPQPPMMPMPPPGPPLPPAPSAATGAPGAETHERYNARLTRARSSNRLRSASAARLPTACAPAPAATSVDVIGPSRAASEPIAPSGLLRRMPQRPVWTAGVRTIHVPVCILGLIALPWPLPLPLPSPSSSPSRSPPRVDCRRNGGGD